MTETTLGRRIGQRRKMLGLSQESFGEKMGVSRQAISKWEADAAIPEVDRLVEMSKIFGVSVDWLLGIEEQGKEEPKKDEEPVNPFVAAFRPPEVVPEPEPESEPEPEPEPELKPEPAPEKPRPRWLNWAAAAVAGASLALSVAAVFISGSRGGTEPDAELAALKKRLAEQEQTISDLSQRMDTVADLNYEQRLEIYDLKNALEKLKNPDQTTSEPTEVLERYELTVTADLAANTASIRFSCLTGTDASGATLVIRSGETVVQTLPCVGVGGIFTAQTQLEPKNGYRYTLLLDYADGSVKSTEVTNSAASNLLDGMSPGVYGVVKQQAHYNLDSDLFWVAYDKVTLTLPKLDESGRAYRWAGLTLSYVYNDQHQSSVDLETLLPELDLTAESLEFQIPMQFFDMPGCEKGDTHRLILQGRLESEDVSLPICETLSTWVVRDGSLVLVTNDTL